MLAGLCSPCALWARGCQPFTAWACKGCVAALTLTRPPSPCRPWNPEARHSLPAQQVPSTLHELRGRAMLPSRTTRGSARTPPPSRPIAIDVPTVPRRSRTPPPPLRSIDSSDPVCLESTQRGLLQRGLWLQAVTSEEGGPSMPKPDWTGGECTELTPRALTGNLLHLLRLYTVSWQSC